MPKERFVLSALQKVRKTNAAAPRRLIVAQLLGENPTMSVISDPHHADRAAATFEASSDELRSVSMRPRRPGADALAAGRRVWVRAAVLKRDAARSRLAARIGALADKTAAQTKQATTAAMSASKTGLATAAEIGRESVLPEIVRTGAKVKERTRPERLARDYRNGLCLLHANLFDRGLEKLFFRPTGGEVAREELTIRSPRAQLGHAYRAIPAKLLHWAFAAIDEDLAKFSFVDYGAGKGRALLVASHYPFKQIIGVEFAEELHDAAMMNIAQFPRSRMKCREAECVLGDAAEMPAVEGPAIHYFFDPFGSEVLAEVVSSLVASYRANVRRLYLVTVDMVGTNGLIEQSGIFKPLDLPPWQRLRFELLSPYPVAIYRTLA